MKLHVMIISDKHVPTLPSAVCPAGLLGLHLLMSSHPRQGKVSFSQVWCVAAGSCVCNEANLTGEALPIQKRQCPVEDVGYEVKGHSARHTLLSSTLVVQAGNSHSKDVLAVVSATGMPLCKTVSLSVPGSKFGTRVILWAEISTNGWLYWHCIVSHARGPNTCQTF